MRLRRWQGIRPRERGLSVNPGAGHWCPGSVERIVTGLVRHVQETAGVLAATLMLCIPPLEASELAPLPSNAATQLVAARFQLSPEVHREAQLWVLIDENDIVLRRCRDPQRNPKVPHPLRPTVLPYRPAIVLRDRYDDQRLWRPLRDRFVPS